MSVMLIALTGGIASGKTIASDYLADLGLPVIDTDVVAREVVQPGSQGLSLIREEFGGRVMNKEGGLDRSALKQLVFNDVDKLKKLNAILHPLIQQGVGSHLRSIDRQLAVIVIPLLTSQVVNAYAIDRVLMIDVSQQVQLKRVMSRDQVGQEMAHKIIDSQPDRLTKLALADDVLVNHDSIASLKSKLKLLLPVYLALKSIQR
ncbi:dephospho-CoA kinase [Marinicella sediminis]|uniref:Dephospho-CoA kinase n=2 Tax=Marinicella sediminis TaxID=1792834 RepID=A0ABV7J6S3_9GAMM